MDLEISQIMEQLRKARSTAKGNVTRKANKLNELLTACDNVDTIKEIANDLDEVSIQFQSAHEAYHSLLKEEQDLNDSTVYFNSVDELVSELKTKTKLWLEQPVTQFQENQIQPHDSVSTVGSHKSSRFSTRSKTSSIKSTSSAKAKAAAKQAALEAKANALQKLHELQFEELKIQQRKSQVELQGAIAAAEAQKIVFEQCEAEELRLSQEENRPLSVHPHHISTTSVVDVVPANHPAPLQSPRAQAKYQPKETPVKQQRQQLNPSVPQWLPNQSSLPHHHDGYPHDYPLQRLMETQDRQSSKVSWR
ncbi:Hypothetical predicted protein [Paramuricea clavata]|uniref:Uncharacterized protein n=1 Tax=Paramuricea clavata TaxID=317549 RepID=A0A6S7JZN0_PARCT|nr:Hypothetical predicted protein [Paramuricea clavata]